MDHPFAELIDLNLEERPEVIGPARLRLFCLLGTLDRSLVARVPTDEVAYAVSALAGVALDPERCGPTEAPLDTPPT